MFYNINNYTLDFLLQFILYNLNFCLKNIIELYKHFTDSNLVVFYYVLVVHHYHYLLIVLIMFFVLFAQMKIILLGNMTKIETFNTKPCLYYT